ncbi:zinc-ribbon domain-containing protein [Neokomagataea anthophila]|uniref:Zinc-ribbon domain-containing protein n=1 Tax=Neokomagataea anthophila TaxID=2826925 RepID=A0ABS5E6A4_9PROT|nr:zinc-ribbon domain-containing protein [Neokomagataea anthophila]MBR0559043.1 zinc-ribbon domain-containing protein [Neokomagataea anthophila]
MRIECLSCYAVFDVPEQRLEAVRTVRCGFCQHVWAAPAPQDVSGFDDHLSAAHVSEAQERFDDVLEGAEPMPEALDVPSAAPTPEVEPERRRGPSFHVSSETPWQRSAAPAPEEKKTLGSQRLWTAAWAGSFLCVLGLGGMAWHQYAAPVQHVMHNVWHKA